MQRRKKLNLYITLLKRAWSVVSLVQGFSEVDAIARAAHNPEEAEAAKELVAWIRRQLAPCENLPYWLEVNHGIDLRPLYTQEYQARLRATRMAWIDSLIRVVESDREWE